MEVKRSAGTTQECAPLLRPPRSCNAPLNAHSLSWSRLWGSDRSLVEKGVVKKSDLELKSSAKTSLCTKKSPLQMFVKDTSSVLPGIRSRLEVRRSQDLVLTKASNFYFVCIIQCSFLMFSRRSDGNTCGSLVGGGLHNKSTVMPRPSVLILYCRSKNLRRRRGSRMGINTSR